MARAATDAVVQDVEIVKPLNDKREYRIIELENELKAVLISDPTTDKASAALDVNCGSFCDPDDLLGLAHFTEHMLFYASEKYPGEDEYSKYIQAHGGKTNAYTAVENTNFHFDVNHDHLEQALDRFAQFFICPLISEDGVEREVKAVDSEHCKNLNTDAWRQQQLWRHLSNRSHVFSRFATGNLDTLGEQPKARGVAVHEAVRNFHAQNYSANVMKLAICGRQTLDELEKVVSDSFAKVVNRKLPTKDLSADIFTEEDKCILVKMVPQMNVNSLSVQWSVPPNWKMYKYSPAHYLSHLLGDEGTGSAFALLKNLGLATGLVAGEGGLSFSSRSVFYVQVELTDKGQEAVPEVLDIIFKYLAILKKEGGINERIFNELKALDEMRFNYRDKGESFNYTRNLSFAMHMYEDKDLLRGGVAQEYKPEAIEKVLNELRPRDARIMWVSKSFEGKTDCEEPWYGTNYCVEKVPEEWINQWEQAADDARLHLPEPNPFVPSDFNLVEKTDESDSPAVVFEDKLVKMWHLTEVSFQLPKANIYLDIQTPQCYASPENAVLSRLFVRMVCDYLNELAYPAELAGLRYSVNGTTSGISVNVSGYSHKLRTLLDSVLRQVVNFKVDGERFNIAHEQAKKDYANFTYVQPYEHAFYASSHVFELKKWHIKEYLEVIDDLGPQDLTVFAGKMFSRMRIEGFMVGNATAEQAKNLASSLSSQATKDLKSRPLFQSEYQEKRVVKLPEGVNHVYTEHGPNPENKNSSVNVVYQIGPDAIQTNALGALLVHIGNREAFSQLRTVEQLGYIVRMMSGSNLGVRTVMFILQSDKFSASYMDGRVEAFIKTLEDHLADDSRFEEAVVELSKMLLEKPKRLAEKAGKMWREIVNATLIFDRADREAEAVRALTKQDLLDFYAKILKIGAERRKLSVQIVGSSEEAEDGEVVEMNGESVKQNVSTITNIWEFKRKQDVFPSIC